MGKTIYLLQMAEFLGWHTGDGCISKNSRYSEYALTGDLVEELPFYKDIVIPAFNKLFYDKLNKKVGLKKYQSTGVCGIYLFNKDFVDFLQREFELHNGKKINVCIPDFVRSYEQKVSFLRGLFDTDGSIFYCRSNYRTVNESLCSVFHYKPKIKLAMISGNLISEVYQLLCDMGFSPMYQKPRKQKEKENIVYSIVIHRNKDTERWIEEIGFKNSKHKTKIELHDKFGFCPANTKLSQRIKMIEGKLNPLTFYPEHTHLSLGYIKKGLAERKTWNIK